MSEPVVNEIRLDIPVEDGWTAAVASYAAKPGEMPVDTTILFKNPAEPYSISAHFDTRANRFTEIDGQPDAPVSRNRNQSMLYGDEITSKIMQAALK